MSLASELLIVKLIVNSNRNSASVIRRQLLHVFTFHPIGFEGLVAMLVSVNMFSKLVLQSFTSRDISALESPFRILDWTCCYRLSDLCSYIGYFTGELQASPLMSLRRWVPWINHLLPVLIHYLEISHTNILIRCDCSASGRQQRWWMLRVSQYMYIHV